MSEKTIIVKAMERSAEEKFKHDWDVQGLEALGIIRRAGPRDQRSLHAAQAIFDNIAEIEQLAGEQGQLYQDDRAERLEWCRLVAMVIEVYFEKEVKT